MDLIRQYKPGRICRQPLTFRTCRTAGDYDLLHHCVVEIALTMQFCSGRSVRTRFCLVGTVKAHQRSFANSPASELTQFNLYLMLRRRRAIARHISREVITCASENLNYEALSYEVAIG